MKKLLFLLSLVLVCTLLAGCQLPIEIPGLTLPVDPNPDSGNTGTNTPAYNDPTHQSGEFRVIFKTGTDNVVHRYDAGEMPDPPTVENYERGPYIMEFSGWDKEFVPVTGNVTYTATYTESLKPYTVTFVYGAHGQRTATSTQKAGTIPTAPEVGNDGEYQFVCWDREIVAGTEATTYTAVYTKLIDAERMLQAYTAPLFDYQIHNWGDMMQACPIYILAYQEHEDPRDGAVRDRLIKQLDALCGKGTAPDFDAWCNWSFPILTASVALVRDTPTVWNALS